jgi:hypothetical protein
MPEKNGDGSELWIFGKGGLFRHPQGFQKAVVFSEADTISLATLSRRRAF